MEETLDELRLFLQSDDQVDVAQFENNLIARFLDKFPDPFDREIVKVALLIRLVGGQRLPSRRTTRKLQEALKSHGAAVGGSTKVRGQTTTAAGNTAAGDAVPVVRNQAVTRQAQYQRI